MQRQIAEVFSERGLVSTLEEFYAVWSVRKQSNGKFGVYCNSIFIGHHAEKSKAEAHCLRLRNQSETDQF